MYEFKRSALALVGVLILVGIATISKPHNSRGASGTSSGAPTSQTQNVNVVNTPSVNAQQTGTWNVGISGTPVVGLDASNNTVKFDAVNNTVKIDPTNPLPVRDVDSPARQPFQADATGSFLNGGVSTGDVHITTVPAGKLLIIEHMSALGTMIVGQKMTSVAIYTTLQKFNNGNGVPHFLAISLQGNNPVYNEDFFAASQDTRLYADPGTEVTGFALRDSTTGLNANAVRFTISGYFVDVP